MKLRPPRFKKSKYFTVILLFCFVFQWPLNAQEPVKNRDGKFLRSEKWERFVSPEKADFYVATNGNDTWSGTLAEPNGTKTDGPFATLKRAQQAVKELKAKVYFPKEAPVEKRWIGSPHPLGKGRDILVYVRGGFYALEEPLIFAPEDGGERIETNLPTGAFEYHKLKDHYVTYAAYPGEKPVISGGKPVTGWKKNGNIWSAPVETKEVNMLVADGKLQVLARTPNTGYFTPPYVSPTTLELPFKQGELRAWDNIDDNRVVMLLRWHTGYNSFQEIDEKKGIARFKQPQDGVVIVPPRYYVENVKALLDAPGEWFFDKKSRELSFIPPAGIHNPNDITISASQLKQLVLIKGEPGKPVRNLRIYGLTFEGTQPGDNAVSYEYAHACELVGNEMRSCGGAGVFVKRGCYQTRILDNRFEKIENRAIVVDGEAEPVGKDDILRETTISYNQIYDCGGVNVYAVNSLYTTISHNYITKTRGRYGIDVGRWQNLEEAIDGNYLVEYNHLDDVQKDADDSGAIKTTGLSFNSVVRRNLIHDVHRGFFNDNVAFWFDNMSLGWTAEENIYYNLEQGEMKLCAAYLEDNIYRNNFKIDAPENKPELIIDGEPDFRCDNLQVILQQKTASDAAETGSVIIASATVFNSGSTGIGTIDLYLDGKIKESQSFPVVRNNSRTVSFPVRIYDPGEHRVAIGDTEYKTFRVEGNKPSFIFEDLVLSHNRLPEGGTAKVTAVAKNLLSSPVEKEAQLFVDNKVVAKLPVKLAGNGSQPVQFTFNPEVGEHSVRIENSQEAEISVFGLHPLQLSKKMIKTYASAKAKPYEIEMDVNKNKYRIKASGSDFFHAEDSYASVFVEKIKGDFQATVKITAFGERTHEWFRSGLFVRNDITQSFDTRPGSAGSVLLFGTPGRAGIHYDEFGDGCMHKASSQNVPEEVDVPIWLRLVRHGNRFTGYVSYDGKNWVVEKPTSVIPGLNEAIDIGLAAGSCDKNQYWVEFSDWVIEVEN